MESAGLATGAQKLLGLLAQAETPSGGLFLQLVPFILIFGVMYFLLILPAQRQRKKHSRMLEELKNGDKVVTSGGLMGTVTGVKDGVVQLRLGDNVRIEVLKSYIAGHQPGSDEAAKD